MRLFVFCLTFFLLVQLVFGLKVVNTGLEVDSVHLYGDRIAFVSKGKIQFYDISKQKVIPVNLTGFRPHMFAYTLVFETKEGVVNVFDVHENEIIASERGRFPNTYNKFVAFATNEQNLGIDFNNDGDITDDIIRVLDLRTGEIAVTKAVGTTPVVGADFVAFIDGTIKIYDLRSKKVDNLHVQGTSLTVEPKQGFIVFVSDDGSLGYVKHGPNEVFNTGFSGENPSIFKTTIAFTKDGKLCFYNVLRQNLIVTEVYGEQPSIFEDVVAFITREEFVGDLNNDGDVKDSILRYAIAEDEDRDNINDFNDNCPVIANEGQEDSDNDGRGDACDEKENKIVPVKITPKNKTVTVQKNETVVELGVEQSGWKWWLVIIIMLIIIIAIVAFFYLPGYVRKKRKSFGF